MSLVVNTNAQAANAARSLNGHYGRLALSTQRLSSGLRVNSAADDAAGLAIRELQRADIAALNQGARNANDAISLIQVADGALGIIDEKLIRMKELAEQAATGTYDSTQRLMIESEYQAMASEITRIANATDFNGIHLLDGSLAGVHDGGGLAATGSMKIHFGSGNDSAEDYYYVEIGDCTSAALGLGSGSTWQDVQRRAVAAFGDSLRRQINENKALSDEEKGLLLDAVDRNAAILNDTLGGAVNHQNAWQYWVAPDGEGFMPEGKDSSEAARLMEAYLSPLPGKAQEMLDGLITVIRDCAPPIQPGQTIGKKPIADFDWNADYIDKVKVAYRAYAVANGLDVATVRDCVNGALGTYPLITDTKTYERFMVGLNGACDIVANNPVLKAEIDRASLENVLQNPDLVAAEMDAFWDGLRDTEKQKLQYVWGQAAIYNMANADPARPPDAYGIGGAQFDFGDDIGDPDIAKTMLAQALTEMRQKVGNMDFAGYTIETQEDAQQALAAIQNAIDSKDKIRASLGATQNRLEKTLIIA